MSTDSEIIERSRDRPDAFGELFERHAPRVLAYARRRVGDHGADVVSWTT